MKNIRKMRNSARGGIIRLNQFDYNFVRLPNLTNRFRKTILISDNSMKLYIHCLTRTNSETDCVYNLYEEGGIRCL